MVVLGAIVLVAALFFVVGYPLFRRPKLEEAGVAEDSRRQDLVVRRESAYAALQELEFDLAAGSLSQEDYRDMEARYKNRALTTLKELDNLGNRPGPEQEIEREIRALRSGGKSVEVEALRGPGKGPEAEIEAEVRKLRRRGKGLAVESQTEVQKPSQANFCSHCGAGVQPGANFCSKCGERL